MNICRFPKKSQFSPRYSKNIQEKTTCSKNGAVRILLKKKASYQETIKFVQKTCFSFLENRSVLRSI